MSTTNSIDRCLWFDISRTVVDEPSQELVNFLLEKTRAHVLHRHVDRKKEELAMTVVVANLLHLKSQWHLRCLAYSRSSNSYVQNRYNRQPFGFKPLRNVIDGLLACGFVYHRGGYNDRIAGRWGCWSRLIIARKFNEAVKRFQVFNPVFGSVGTELICLKDGDKKLVDYEDTDATIAMREQLEQYNDHLANADIRLDMDANVVKRGLSHSPVDLTCKSYRRVFNRGSFELGGRLYGPWWQNISRRKYNMRKRITINGQVTKEIDYRGLHLALIYSLSGQDPSTLFEGEDPYALDGYHRNIVKAVFFVAINAENWESGKAAAKKKLHKMGISYIGIDFEGL
jgi:hypothetical protein